MTIRTTWPVPRLGRRKHGRIGIPANQLGNEIFERLVVETE